MTEGVPEGVEHVRGCAVGGERRLSAEGEVAVARLALHEGDVSHAAAHLGFAMAEAPQLPEVHEALAELAARGGCPVAATETGGPQAGGTETEDAAGVAGDVGAGVRGSRAEPVTGVRPAQGAEPRRRGLFRGRSRGRSR